MTLAAGQKSPGLLGALCSANCWSKRRESRGRLSVDDRSPLGPKPPGVFDTFSSANIAFKWWVVEVFSERKWLESRMEGRVYNS